MVTKLVNKVDARRNQPLLRIIRAVYDENNELIGLLVEYSSKGLNGYTWLCVGSPDFSSAYSNEVEL